MDRSFNQVSLTYSADHKIAIISLGSPGERAVTLTEERLESLESKLKELATQSLLGLVIAGTSKDMFTVGADVNVIGSVVSEESGSALAGRGQGIFNLIEDLPYPVVAAISGPCVGGGCELALSCTYRIITQEASSVIGLPETKLGIIPGFGGTVRLPKLLGLYRALMIILKGQTLKSLDALKLGLVDDIVSYDSLLVEAEKILRGERKIKRKKISFLERFFSFTTVGRSILTRKVRSTLITGPNRFYPAPIKALEVTSSGVGLSRTSALKQEAEALGRMIVTTECKALVNIFFASEASKANGKAARDQVQSVPVAVIGSGTMGSGIALSFAKAGHSVLLRDSNDAAICSARERLGDTIKRQRRMPKAEQRALESRIEFASFPSRSLDRCGLIVEAIFERLDVKREVLSEVAKVVSSDAIIASNTSSLSLTEIAHSIPHPERVVGMHFFNPVDRMPLVEIVRAQQTSEQTIQAVAAFASRLGKFPIVVNDVPGFLVNRILVPYLNEAAFLLEDGFSVSQIDSAALEFGLPMGPIRLLDEVGLDVASHVAEVMISGYGDRMKAPTFAAKLVSKGRLGKKSRAGFYDYSKDGKESPWEGLNQELSLTPKTLDTSELQDRLILHFVHEAFSCWRSGVAGTDMELAKKQIDLGSVMGFGFPAFLGGVISYAERRGIDEIAQKLRSYRDRFGVRYEEI